MDRKLENGLVGLRPLEKRSLIGVMPNAQHQDAKGFMQGTAPYELAIVEFDDQGCCYERAQLDLVSARIENMRENLSDAVILVFVHGWKHDARSDDDNLTSFRDLLTRTAEHERNSAAGDIKPRPVLGVFVGWRGLTTYSSAVDAVADATFWGRQEAAHRVSTGSVRELFGRLRHYRNALVKRGGSPLLVIAGHSFGGMIVYSALAQSLIEAASVPDGHIIPGFADLVLLINPAIEGARYLPIQDLVASEQFKKRTNEQLPVFICIQAENDQPVGTWFPVGNAKNRLEEAAIGDLEQNCVSHAIGFIEEFRTHYISAATEPFVLEPSKITQINPFWVVSATKEVIDGHGGITKKPFLSFLAAVIFQHAIVSKTAASPAKDSPEPLATALVRKHVEAKAATQGTLADFARTL